MEKQIEIKEEDPVRDDIVSQNEREFVQKVNTVKTSNDAVLLDADSDMAVKSEIKLETPFIKHTAKQIKAEAVTCSNNWEMHGSNEVEQNKGKYLPEDPVIMDKKYSSDHEIHNKIEIKEESWWLERETSSASDNSKEAFAEPKHRDKDPLSSQLPSLTLQGVSEERDISTSLIYSEPRGRCQMEPIPSYLKIAKFAATPSKEFGRSEKSFKPKPEPRPYKCNKCEKSFKQKSHLNKHIRLHSDTRPYKCEKCEKSFKEKCNLKSHILLHLDTTPYKCNKCEKAFKQKYYLDQHILLHSDTRIYQCEKCEKSFKRKPDLNQHILVHSDTKLYKCDKCEKSFKRKTGLNSHVKSHSDIRPYKCDRCGKCFKHNSNFKRHIVIHLGKETQM